MPRPCRMRWVHQEPDVIYFKPQGVPMRHLEEVILTVEELESLRLKEIEEFDQEKAAKKMKISQPTFHRILDSARKKLADAIVNGKAIKIRGGNYKLR